MSTDIDECASDDLNNCDDNASCSNTEGSFSCTCNIGFTGNGVTCDGLFCYFLILISIKII